MKETRKRELEARYVRDQYMGGRSAYEARWGLPLRPTTLSETCLRKPSSRSWT